jgi:hypothetical protein
MNDKQIFKNAQKWQIMSMMLETMGVYPASMVKNGVKTERTEWQNGWNASQMALVVSMSKVEEYFEKLDEETILKLINLSDDSIIFCHVNSDKEDPFDMVRFVVNCGDIFYLSCADCEEISVDEIGELWDMCYDNCGNKKPYGGAAWCVEKRKLRPCSYAEEKMRHFGSWKDEWNDFK